jgi:hypothetical protein
MSRANYYSPRISRPLITSLYNEAKRRGIPMTSLVDQIIENGLPAARITRVSESDPTSESGVTSKENRNEV